MKKKWILEIAIGVILVGIVIGSVAVGSYRVSVAKEAAGQLFVQMQEKDTAGTLRSEPARKLAKDIRTLLRDRYLELSTIYAVNGTLESIISRGCERDATETLHNLRATHGNPDAAMHLSVVFEDYKRCSGEENPYYGTSWTDIDRQIFRNKIEKAINDGVHVSAADCIKAGIPIPTKTVIRNVPVPVKSKPPIAKAPATRKPLTRRPVLRNR